MMARQGELNLQYPTFPHLLRENEGVLIDDVRCWACWYYYVIAQKAREEYGTGTDSQIILEGNAWKNKHYTQQKKSVGMLFGIQPDEMNRFWPLVTQQAEALSLPTPDSAYMYVNPLQVGGIE